MAWSKVGGAEKDSRGNAMRVGSKNWVFYWKSKRLYNGPVPVYKNGNRNYAVGPAFENHFKFENDLGPAARTELSGKDLKIAIDNQKKAFNFLNRGNKYFALRFKIANYRLKNSSNEPGQLSWVNSGRVSAAVVNGLASLNQDELKEWINVYCLKEPQSIRGPYAVLVYVA